MNKIIPTIKLRMQGQPVADLQDGLLQALDRGHLLRENEIARRELAAALKPEREKLIFADATAKLVNLFQKEHGLPATGEVEERTADALNALLLTWGMLDGESAPLALIVTGAVRREDGLPLQDMHVQASHQSAQGPIRLGDDTTDAQGRYTIRYQPLPNVKAIELTVSAISEDGRPLVSSKPVSGAKSVETIDLTVPVAAAANERHTITGTVMFEHGLPAEKLTLRLYRRDFGSSKGTRLKETITVTGGGYVFVFDGGTPAASFEVRAVKIDGSEVALSKPINDIKGSRTGLNLVAPKSLQPLAAEYRRLSTALTPHIGDMKNLAGAKEGTEQQDLTVLNRATGWDARLIALASIAERLAADSEVGLTSDVLYGMLRAGLPSDKLLLAKVEPEAVGMAIKKVRDAGIIDIDDAGINTIKTKFSDFAKRVMLSVKAPGSLSTYGELLQAANVSDATRTSFSAVYLKHRGTGAQLWEAASKANIAAADIGKLQLQGKLAYLVGNSAAMTKRLQDQLKDPAELVDRDFHRADIWKNEVLDLAGIAPARRTSPLTPEDSGKVATVIPNSYAGDGAAARLEAYAQDMARKLRLSYPTQVLARLIDKDTKFKLPKNHDATLKLLKAMMAKGFKLGETPASTFLKSTTGLRGDLSEADFNAAGQRIKELQRVYQITPCNEAMPVLMSLGMTSAFDVMAYSQEQFLALFQAKFRDIWGKPAPSGVSELISRKAKQVSSITYNLFTIAKKMNSEPPIAGLSAPPEVRESVKNELIKQYPTMESLFGSMDYCECEHCRSVLSPAAYFVDLLQFVDIESGVWENFLAQWKKTHGEQDYPHKNAAGVAMKPYDVLIERRPDLPYIALTCDNTNTALPYIDIVNEVLEYYVANGKLTSEAVHDTGEATTAELLAEPQNVTAQAYTALREARYPLKLPFDLWTETVRQFCDYFETPLHQMLEIFRTEHDLLPPEGAARTSTYYRSAIFMESLGLSAAELAIFTDPTPLADNKWQQLYGGDTPAILRSAKALSRRLGVTYKEIAEIVQTSFVNPELSKLGLLYKLGVSIRDAKLYKDNLLAPSELEAFERRLAEHVAAFTPAPNLDNLRTAIRAIPFERVLVLADPDTGCNFDLTTVQYANGAPADAIMFLRINLFVRLWRKLGWSIEETDSALTTFIPRSVPFDANPDNLRKQPLQTALIYLAHLKTLDGKLKVGKQSRIKLLTLWSNIPITGKKPLYAQLFLNRTVLKASPVFDNPLGLYLTDTRITMKPHALALQGALGLTDEEIGSILTNAGTSLDTAALTLQNVSLLYRYGLFAKALKLSIRELITLKQLSGIDPFQELFSGELKNLNDDYPFSQTLEFVKVVEEVKDLGLKIDDLDYLLRHRDESGKYQADRNGILLFIKSLSEGVRAIRTEHAVPANSNALSEEVLKQKLGLALSPDVVERLLGMVNTTAEFTATKIDVEDNEQLDPKDVASEERIREVSYNAVRKEQKLTVRGVLLQQDRIAMQIRLGAALTPVAAQLLEMVEKAAHAFFDNQLKKQRLRLDGEAGFLEESDFVALFSPLVPPAEIPSEDAPKWIEEELQRRRYRIAQAFLPFLQQRLIRQFIVQAMTTRTGADPTLVESLVVDERLLAAPDTPLVAATATAARGLNATFRATSNGTGAALTTALLTDANVRPGPAEANSAHMEAYLEVPATGAYRFYFESEDQNAEAVLGFSHLPEPIVMKRPANTGPATSTSPPSVYVELTAGVLYRLALDFNHLNRKKAQLTVQGETLPRGPLSQLALYPAAAIDAAERATTLLSKSVQLVQSTGLSEREIRYLVTHPTDFDNFSLSELPTVAVPKPDPDRAATKNRLARFRRLAAYVRLKRDLAGGADDLIAIFEANATTAADKLDRLVYPLLAKLTRRDKALVEACAKALVKSSATPTFNNEQPLSRLWEVLQVVERFGVHPAAMLGWTAIVHNASTGQQIAGDLREAIKARFEPEAWQRVAQPIFDKLRQRQRDALVAHVMHQRGFDRIEQLYEHFLIDPGMEPVVQTSRIRLAISSLQLFIQRCLLNLEPKVHPSTINAKHWEWMKRYRVWEANRKIFLFPENWLEPEFRDDKTHLFAELEGSLLQGDVSSDLVEDAFLSYLRKLDELARLDICAMHIEDNADPAQRTLHVFGRTYSQPHKYFYRRYAHQMWTPWEPVGVDIEGDHLAPVVWRDRLYLFWVTFIEQPAPPAKPLMIEPAVVRGRQLKLGFKPTEKKLSDASMSEITGTLMESAGLRKVQAQLHWSEYLQGQWTTHESNGFNAPSQVFRSRLREFDAKKVFVHISKEYEDGNELGVFIHLGGAIRSAFYVAGRNSVPEQAPYSAAPDNRFTSVNVPNANRYDGKGALTVSYRERIFTGPGKTPAPVTPNILQHGTSYTLLPCNNNLTALGASKESYQDAVNPVAVQAAIESGLSEIASLMKPVFYQDNRHTFFIEPEVTERTVEEWQEWVTKTPQPDTDWQLTDWWKKLVVIPEIPRLIPELGGPPFGATDPGSLINPKPEHDWLINNGSVMKFGDVLISRSGQSGLEIQPTSTLTASGALLNVNPGSHLDGGTSVVVSDKTSFANSGLTSIGGGVNVIGSTGFNSALAKNFGEMNELGFDAGLSGVIER